MSTCVVVGGGPAGLMAAEALVDAGHEVIIADQKPTVGRKFLMAGKSGLNLTKAEEIAGFVKAFGATSEILKPMLTEFGPNQVAAWAEVLGQELFTGSSSRIFPKSMKASPLLRAWLARLTSKGVTFKTRWKLASINDDGLVFATVDGEVMQPAAAVVLAMGGASWKKLGSDGAWIEALSGIAEVAPFKPSNMGFRVDWSTHMEKHLGTPVKNLGIIAGETSVRGEVVVSKFGIEGGGIYLLSAAIRDGADLSFDLLPDLTEAEINARLSKPRGKESLSNYLRKRLKIDAVKMALMNEFARPLPDNLAPLLKKLPIAHQGPMDMDGAISTAGGVAFESLDEGLMLKKRPGVFIAGEMLNWEAPTGGYLITACMATGKWAGQHAARWLA